jgi:hypothetical protein
MWPRRNRPRETSLKARLLIRVAGVVALLLVLAAPVPAAADVTTPATYRQAVQDALALVRGALPGDSGTAQRAVTVLEAGAGPSQPEIVADLQRIPPDLEDAAGRLQNLLDALDHPAETSDSAQAQQRLHDVMSMHRYDALHTPATWLDRLRQWVSDRINDLVNLVRGEAGSSPLPNWFFYILGAAAVAVVAYIVFSSTRGRFAAGAVAGPSTGPRAPGDYFAEADRLAAAGDRVGAIRALCAGVAATLAGERTWEGSPLTVREIFQHASDPSSLRPLLAPFEAAIYGGRGVDRATYESAARVAAPFRRPSELAA